MQGTFLKCLYTFRDSLWLKKLVSVFYFFVIANLVVSSNDVLVHVSVLTQQSDKSGATIIEKLLGHLLDSSDEYHGLVEGVAKEKALLNMIRHYIV